VRLKERANAAAVADRGLSSDIRDAFKRQDQKHQKLQQQKQKHQHQKSLGEKLVVAAAEKEGVVEEEVEVLEMVGLSRDQGLGGRGANGTLKPETLESDEKNQVEGPTAVESLVLFSDD
jgi:hypothetical protein